MQKTSCNICGEEYETIRKSLVNGDWYCEHDVKVNTTKGDNITSKWGRETGQDRRKFAKDLLQPFNKGEINKNFVKVHGTKPYEDQFKMSDEDVKKSM